MTLEMERLARMEQKVIDMTNDISELKDDVKDIKNDIVLLKVSIAKYIGIAVGAIAIVELVLRLIFKA